MKENIRDSFIKFSVERGYSKTFCPSEVARDVFSKSDWRSKMDLVREVADQLYKNNVIIVMQNGQFLNQKPSVVKGPIRLRKR